MDDKQYFMDRKGYRDLLKDTGLISWSKLAERPL